MYDEYGFFSNLYLWSTTAKISAEEMWGIVDLIQRLQWLSSLPPQRPFAVEPQGSPQKRPMVVTSKPANGMWPGTRLFYSDASCGGKSVFVRQLRGPHLSTWPWWRRRSSIAVTAALSPSSLPQSSTGRLEVSKVLARS